MAYHTQRALQCFYDVSLYYNGVMPQTVMQNLKNKILGIESNTALSDEEKNEKVMTLCIYYSQQRDIAALNYRIYLAQKAIFLHYFHTLIEKISLFLGFLAFRAYRFIPLNFSYFLLLDILHNPKTTPLKSNAP